MPDLGILNQLIKSCAIIPLKITNGKASVLLTEPQASGSSVNIVGLPSDAIVIKADMFRSPDTIFCGTKGECKRSDYVIIANKEGKKRILFIEMKKTTSSNADITKQLSGSQCFIHYCKEIGKIFWKETNFLKDYHHRFVCFTQTSIPKKRTQIKRTSLINNTPEKMIKISWPTRSEFNHLIGS